MDWIWVLFAPCFVVVFVSVVAVMMRNVSHTYKQCAKQKRPKTTIRFISLATFQQSTKLVSIIIALLPLSLSPVPCQRIASASPLLFVSPHKSFVSTKQQNFRLSYTAHYRFSHILTQYHDVSECALHIERFSFLKPSRCPFECHAVTKANNVFIHL